VGALYVDRRTIGKGFSEGDLDVVVSLATLSATAIDNANLYHELDHKSHQMEVLNNLARILASTHHLEDVMSLVVQMTLEVARAERCYLMLWEQDELVCRALADLEGRTITAEAEVSETICGRVLETGEPLLLEAHTHHPEDLEQGHDRHVMCVPMVAKQRLLGLLYVDSPDGGHVFSDKDLTLLEAISHHASVAIENATLYAQLSSRASELETLVELYEEANMRASSDALTGLQNRRFFLDQIDRSFAQAKRHRRHLSLLVIDIDHFKSFNDTYGHTMGDQVLVNVSQALGLAVRLADVVARYGGEEFIVALPDTDLEGALTVAERMRESVSEVQLEDELGQLLRSITVSIGVSSLRLEDERTAELIERADRGLYEAKSRGRNQVFAEGVME
jgi:diguanylate cyclase (GGDEF)-like protein